MREKTVSESRTEQVHIILPMDVNATFDLFGGKLMEWIDIVAAVVARRHSGHLVTTAAVDHLAFLASAALNDIIVMRGRVTYVGRTSMEICVETFVEEPKNDGLTRKVNEAYLTMVALGADGKPTEVPRLALQTDAERADYEAGSRRMADRKARKDGDEDGGR